jgi:transcriptional regulator with XRE-family HTH domain
MEITLLELYRRQKGLTGRDLARKIHYVTNIISQVETGCRRSWPAFRDRVCEVLQVPEDAIFLPNGACKTVRIDTLLQAVGE